MNQRKDLTRWNRASLTRFRYVDGKAGEYLDILREQLVNNFKDPGTKRAEWLSPAEEIPANEKEPENKTETLLQRQERLSIKQQRILESYDQDRRDWVWEISRTFARACHILTEHTNAYANESYLGTATEWEHVRRLVEMLDYHPAPPASAFTRLTLIAKPNKSGLVAKGFQVKYSPPAGGSKIVFETLNDITIDAARNELRPLGWNQSEDPVVNPEDNNETSPATTEDKKHAPIVYENASHIKGVSASAGEAYALVEILQIIDLVSLDPAVHDLTVSEKASLWDWKAKADILMGFSPKGDWATLETQLLTVIAAASTELLTEQSRNTLEEATDFKLEIEKVELCLKSAKFDLIELNYLLTPLIISPDALVTSWQTKANSNLKPGDITMVCHLSAGEKENVYIDMAEAATVATIDDKTKKILLYPSLLQSEWPDWSTEWSKSETRLKVSPRWERKCWLNGKNVIRTKEPHGITADTHICWKTDFSVAAGREHTENGSSLISMAIEDGLLSIKIFNAKGDIEVNKREISDEESTQLIDDVSAKKYFLYHEKIISAIKQTLISGPEPEIDISHLSKSKKEKLISQVMFCAGYTIYTIAKVLEVDKWGLRLDVDGVLPIHGQELYILHPIEGPNFPANYDVIALQEDPGGEPPSVEPVLPGVPDTQEPLFCLRNIITNLFDVEESGGGGGLLPPASLPQIGSFLFPSPMLPMDLVKAAVELLLSFGVMVIPSTGEVVFKGMPFGGLLDGLSTEVAADHLYQMLEKLEGPVQLHDENCQPLWLCTDGIPRPYSIENDHLFSREAGELMPAVYLPWGKMVRWNDSISSAARETVRKKLQDELVAESRGVIWANLKAELDQAGLDRDPTQGEFNQAVYDAITPEMVTNALNASDVARDTAKNALEKILSEQPGKENIALFQQLIEDHNLKGPVLALPKKPVVKAVVKDIDYPYMFNSTSKIGKDDWVVAEFDSGTKAMKVSVVNRFTESDKTENFALKFHKQNEINSELKKVYADFRNELMPVDAEINTTELVDEIALENVPDSLKVGDDILLTAENKEPIPAKIETIEGNIITTNPTAEGFSKGRLIINANVVLAGHGETKPEKIIGSGNAAISNQTFIIEVVGVSFTHDATKSSGVAAAIEVNVAGRVWEQVSTLKDSAPSDFHYAIRMTEEAYVKIIFGDGEHGRRLPSGTNNIRVRYRVGSGLAGIVSAHGLEKPVNPHPLIDEVRQPIQTAGGGDMEDVTSLRENAPPTLLALERAVSLSDFSHLAASQSNIWQAKAFSQILHGGRTESVRVVVVPAGGANSTDVNEKVRTFLQEHALPGVQVTIDNAVKKRFSLLITVRVKIDEFIAEQVVEAVKATLINHFALQHRKLGQNLYLSEIYKVVEAVLGVENSICELKNATTQQLIRADNESTVVYMDTENGSTLDVIHEEYQP